MLAARSLSLLLNISSIVFMSPGTAAVALSTALGNAHFQLTDSVSPLKFVGLQKL